MTSFYVDLSARDGLKRRTPAPLEGRVLFLDTRPLHALLVQHIVVLEQKVKTQPLSDRTAKRSEQLALLTKLASQVDPEFKPFARRGERTATVGTVDAIVGFANIANYLRDEERNPVRQGGQRQELRRHDGACGVRADAQRAGPHPRAGAATARHACGARRPVGGEGRIADRLSPDRADDGRERGDARARRPRCGRTARSDGRWASCGESSGSRPTAPRSDCR